MTQWINLQALWKILVVGLIAGAGLPALFAVGLRAISLRRAGEGPLPEESDHVLGDNPAGIAAGVACFAVVLVAIAWGIYLIVKG